MKSDAQDAAQTVKGDAQGAAQSVKDGAAATDRRDHGPDQPPV